MKPHNVKTSHWLAYNSLYVSEHILGHKLYKKLFGGVEASLFSAIDKYAATAPKGEPFKVIEYQVGDKQEPYPHPLYPVIFRGAALDWQCTQKWSFDFFSEKFGNNEIVITNNVGLNGNGQNKFETLKLRDYITELKSGSMKYLKFSQMIHESSDLQEDFNGSWLQNFHKASQFKKLFFLFMGAKGTATPIHCGLPPTVFVQIYGAKKWKFYPASDRLFLGARPERKTYFYSNADTSAPPNPDFPLLDHLSMKEVTIYPGDVLWFPALVWHQVENASDSIGVAYKFFHLPSSFTSSRMLTTLFFFATKPLLIKSAIIAKITKKEYIYNHDDGDGK
jgi:hypothetical protein